MKRTYVDNHIIFETVVGSRAYGINTPESDYDKAGVMIPGTEYFYGFKRFEQYKDPDTDRTIYDIRKALKLIADNNPNMMDLLFVPQRCVVRSSSYWEKIQEQSQAFISKRCRYTYSRYAIAQLERIKTHRKFLLDPPEGRPSRSSFDLSDTPLFPTSQIKAVCSAALDLIAEEERPNLIDEIDKIYGDYVVPLFGRYIKESQRQLGMEWIQLGVKAQAKSILSLGSKFIKEEYLDQARKELAFYHAQRNWERYISWKKYRNKKRAEIEKKFGFDLKHASHLVRLCRMGEEILTSNKVNVDRTQIDAEELKAIRNGLWSYEEIEEYAKKMDSKLDSLYKKSSLPKTPNYEKIDLICVEATRSYIQDSES